MPHAKSRRTVLFKLLRRIICISFFLLVLFLVFAFYEGGDIFRRFGDKVKTKSEEVAKEADDVKKTADDVKEYVEKGMEGLGKAKETIKDFGKEGEKTPEEAGGKEKGD